MQRFILKSKTLPELKSKVRSIERWRSVALNVVLADTDGNIGYMLVQTSAERASFTPYTGCSVLDGTTSEHDWINTVETKKLPFVLNPEKGYFVSANNRIVPETAKYDIGATMPSTGRAVRIVELIEQGIAAGKKFDENDMIDMQQDEVDVFARGLAPQIVKITKWTV